MCCAHKNEKWDCHYWFITVLIYLASLVFFFESHFNWTAFVQSRVPAYHLCWFARDCIESLEPSLFLVFNIKKISEQNTYSTFILVSLNNTLNASQAISMNSTQSGWRSSRLPEIRLEDYQAIQEYFLELSKACYMIADESSKLGISMVWCYAFTDALTTRWLSGFASSRQ